MLLPLLFNYVSQIRVYLIQNWWNQWKDVEQPQWVLEKMQSCKIKQLNSHQTFCSTMSMKTLDVSGFWRHECTTILIKQDHLSLKKIQTVKEYKFHLTWILLLCYCLYYQEFYLKHLLKYIMFQFNILISHSLPSSGQRSSLLSDPDTSGTVIGHKQVFLL